MFSLQEHDEYYENTKLNNILELEIEENEKESIQDFLNFIYTAEKPITEVSKLISLFELSDKYCISSLKNYCELQLTINICPEIAIDLLLLAYKNNSTILENKIIEYLSTNMNINSKIKESLSKLINYPSLMIKIAKFQN